MDRELTTPFSQSLLDPPAFGHGQERAAPAPFEARTARRGRANGIHASNLTVNQLHVWMGQALVPELPVYNLAGALTIQGRISLDHFSKAFHVVVNSSDALRTVFEEIDGVPMQKVLPQISYTMEFVDLSAFPDPPARATAWMNERCARPLSWQKQLFDSALIQISPGEFVWYLNVHHLVCDGWSFELIYRHMGELYSRSLREDLPDTIPLFTFAEYLAYERASRDSSRHRKAEAYWRRELENFDDALYFYGRSRGLATTRVRRISRALGPERTAKLKSVAASLSLGTEEASLFEVITSAFLAYLHCLNRKQSYTVGVPFHNRRSKEFKQTIGFFSEVLPLRVDLAESDTFVSLANRVRAQTLKALRHGQFSLANPYFRRSYEVALNCHTRSMTHFAGMPATPRWIHNGHGEEALAIQTHDFESSHNLTLDFDLHEDMFDEAECELVIAHFLRVLDTLLTDPKQHLWRVRLLSEEEAEVVLLDWSQGHRAAEVTTPVHVLFEEQTEKSPDAVAVIFEQDQLTYTELNSRANQLAHYLIQQGVGPETLVGIFADRSLETVIAILGVLKAGGAYVPLDPSYPADWLQRVLNETQAPLVLTQRCLLELLPSDGPRIVCLDEVGMHRDGQAECNPAVPISEDHLAYVIYTSGSTGEVKGVQVTHKGLANFAVHMSANFDLGPTDRVLQFASISFDTAVEEIFPSFIRGATLVLRVDSMLESPARFLQTCRALGITMLDLPTAYWHELAAVMFRECLALPESVRLVVIGGERAVPERLILWQACEETPTRLVNTYGPTEATVATTAFDVTDLAACGSNEEVSIGRPIANVAVYVLDAGFNPVPPGVSGELYIGGAGVARGYVGRSDLTAEKFIPNPFSRRPGERLYKTGDLVRYRPDGNLDFLGRRDRQVKIRGYRVELDGIEATLATHPLVREVAVVKDDARSQSRLLAHFVPMEGATLNEDDLRNFARNKMAEYMIPGAFIIAEGLPRTASGKLDREGLRRLSARATGNTDRSELPQNKTEERIARIWADVLGLEQVGRNEHFFQLGAHSLIAIQVMSRLREEYHLDLPLRAIFEAPTVRELALYVNETMRDSQRLANGTPIFKGRRDGELPLSFSQARIWFMHQLAPDSAAYNIAAPIRFTGELRKEALRRSLEEMVRRHESLRTRFATRDDKPVQVILPEMSIDLPEVDLTHLPGESGITEARRILRQHAQQPFDLENDPLFRVLLVRLGREDHVLLLSMHHVISDQWSFGVIAREVTKLYNLFCRDMSASIDPLEVQYADFAAWQEKWLTGEQLEKDLAYWKTRLAGLQSTGIPTDHQRPPIQTFIGAHQQFALRAPILEGVKRLSLEENATLYLVFLTVFKIMLQRYAGQDDVSVGSPVANRTRVEWEGIVGTFINILILRSDLSGNPTFRELLRRVREVVLEAFAHQELPFEKLVNELQPHRDPSRPPLVQMLFNFQSAPMSKVDLKGLSWTPFEIDQWASQFDLTFTVDPQITRKILISYNTDLFEAETIARMLRSYQNLLEGVIANPDRPIRELPILTDAERERVLLEWNDTRAECPPCCVHELFEMQAERTPHACAVICEDQALTYQELNERAEQLARHLRAVGVKPDVPVGICMQRSAELVIGLLGILKAGGAYVPIDPAYPAERVKFMIEDSQMPVLLTQEALVESLPPAGQRIVTLERLAPQAGAYDETDSETGPKPDSLAYVIYTSGSTGRPKAVEIPHKALVNFIASMRETPGITPLDTLMSVTTIAFDIAALEIFLPLMVGARVVLVSREVASDGRQLRKHLETSDATIMQATPATWRMLLDAGWTGSKTLKILCGGEALSQELAKALVERSSSVWNLYGPTESTVWSTVWQVQGNRIAIGRPIHNTQVYVLDSHLQPVPVGVAGQLYIGGAGVARGYRNRPELTAEKFIDNLRVAGSETRVFKTGDLARYLPDGNLEWLGRTDDQVKIRGHRVEVGEIEAMLERHPSVSQAVVTAFESVPGERKLAAYAVLKNGFPLRAEELRDFLKKSLPDFMVPSHFISVEAFPMTPNGKVNRLALPAPTGIAYEESAGFLAPRDRLECELVRIWEKVLNVMPIGVRDNFFDLGGHSLLAVRLLGRIEKELGTHVTLAGLFTAPTVEQLARVVRQGGCSREWSSLIPIQPAGSKPPLFWVHGYRGGIALPRYLGQDQPLYALMPQSHDGRPAGYQTIEEIAGHYLEDVRTVQSTGPYFLAGYSLGGVVAFEMAQQLRKIGEPIALLLLVDATSANDAPGRGSRISCSRGSLEAVTSTLAAARTRLQRLGGFSIWEKWRYVLRGIKRKVAQAYRRQARKSNRMAKSIGYKIFLAAGQPIPAMFRTTYVMDVYHRARRAYKPRMYSGRIVFFRAVGNRVDLVPSWSQFAEDGLEIHAVPGHHMSVVNEPNLGRWAEELKAVLQEAQSAADSARHTQSQRSLRG